MSEVIHDGPFKTEMKVQQHENRLYALKTQTNEDAILRRNAELRKLDMRPTNWQQPIACIPQIMLAKWYKENPELRSPIRSDRENKLRQLIEANPEVKVVQHILTPRGR